MDFKDLHNQDQPLLLCNVWDVASAKLAEKLNFQSIGTSSAAIAAMLGYKDGEDISFAELEYIIQRIAANSPLALSVDLEAGYSREPEEIIAHINRLAKLGVCGVNIEDSIVDNQRHFLAAESFARTLAEVSQGLSKEKSKVFINVRTDAFILKHPNALEETLRRIELYEKAGAHGVFIPCIVKEKDIEAVVNSTELPINVMCMPDLPDFTRLKELGVKRISMGNFLFDRIYYNFEQELHSLIASNSFLSIFAA